MRWLILTLPLVMVGCLGTCDSMGGGQFAVPSVGPGMSGSMSTGPGGACSSNVSAGAILDLNFALDCTGSSAAIASITNDGSTADTFTQATEAKKPTCQSTCTGLGGGAACAYFDGGDSLVSAGGTSTWADLWDADDLTMYVVIEAPAAQDGADGTIMESGAPASRTGVEVEVANAAGTTHFAPSYAIYDGSAPAPLSGNTGADATYDSGHVLTFTFDYLVAGDDMDTMVNGSSVFTEEIADTPPGGAGFAALTIGKRAGFDLEILTAYVGRILAYDSLHDAATITANESALDCQFGNSGWPK